MPAVCLVCHQQQTFLAQVGTSHLGHKQALAVAVANLAPDLATVQVAANVTHFHRPMSRDPLAVSALIAASGMQAECLVSH